MTKGMDFWGGIKPLPVKKGAKNKPTEWNWLQTKRALPHIKKWGDMDMDGSPNWLDCRPLDPSKDGVFSYLKEKFMKRGKGSETEVSVQESTYSGKSKKKKLWEEWQRRRRAKAERKRERERPPRAPTLSEESKTILKPYLPNLETETQKKERLTSEKAKTGGYSYAQIEAARAARQEKIRKGEEWERRTIRKAAKAKLTAMGYQTEAPSKGDLLSLSRKMHKRASRVMPQPERTRAHVGAMVSTLTGVEMYGGQGQKQFKTMYKGKGQKGTKGRPVGSWKYSIPGKGRVPVHVYKSWVKSEKAKYRLKGGGEGGGQPIQYREEGEARQYQPAVRTAVITEEGVVEVQRPAMDTPQSVPYERVATGEPPLQRQTHSQEEFQARKQQQMNQSDNPLHAPQVFRGELQGRLKGFAGGPVGSHILQAPNINRGEMRADYYRDTGQYGEVVMKEPVQDWDTVERPINNPYGDEYTDIDPASGRPILRKRIRERWISPEAP